jgi:hypothetical protein
MYLMRAELTDVAKLDQGDIVSRVVVPRLAVGRAFGLRQGSKITDAIPEGTLAKEPLPTQLRLVCEVQRLDLAIVLSNSCDNQKLPILMAPVVPFAFKRAETPAEEWLEISHAATGTASPKLLYLPASPQFGLKRSEAELSRMTPVDHSVLQRGIDEGGMKRICGLNDEALVHLQHHLSMFFGRHSRDDYAWPSLEDLNLKQTWLEEQLASPGGSKRHAELKVELERVKLRIAEFSRSPLPQPSNVPANQGAVAPAPEGS